MLSASSSTCGLPQGQSPRHKAWDAHVCALQAAASARRSLNEGFFDIAPLQFATCGDWGTLAKRFFHFAMRGEAEALAEALTDLLAEAETLQPELAVAAE
jgi:hypothetical protein